MLSVKQLLTKKFKFTPAQTLSTGFLIAIILGTLLLKLPISTTKPITWIDALFTATSATTVTGLVVVSTGHDFTLYGQIIILCLIQLGGLGLMTFAVFIVLALGKRIGLRQRILLQEALNQTSIGGVIRLVKILFVFTILIEFIASILLSILWVPEYGWREGIYQSIFHTISAFNNAGFSLWDDSLSRYVNNPGVNLLITFLFITGGIGFTVLADLWYSKKISQWSLHTKLMVLGTVIINLIATIVIFLLEYGNPITLGQLSLDDKWWGAYFQAVATRTAGFNSIDIGNMTVGSLVLMCMLMFIGAGSASTGSGVKVTTFIVIVLATLSYFKGKQEPVVFGRTIKNDLIVRSLAIVVISLLAVFLAIFFLSITEKAPFLMIVFESFSAFGTVGLSMGLTAQLTTMGKVVIILLMFLGRIGPLTLAYSLANQQPAQNIRYPDGQIFTG